MSKYIELCEECGEPAKYLVQRRVIITNLATNAVRTFPGENDIYEEELLASVLCEDCVNEEGFTNDELPI